MRLLALLTCLFALSLTAAACGSDDEKDSGGGDGAAATTEEAPAGGAGGGGNTVSMKDIQFDPKELTVKPGDTVTWSNDEAVGHDVTADDGSFKSGDAGGLQQGQKFNYKFAKAGDFAYKCTVHPNMTGTVKVAG